MDQTNPVLLALRFAVNSIKEAVAISGPLGAPSGVIYAAMSAHGMKLHNYQNILNALVDLEIVVVENDLVKRGPQFDAVYSELV